MAIAQVTAGNKIITTDLNAYYNLLKGAAGETVTLVYNAAGAVILQPSSDPATGTELIQIKNNAGTVQMALSSDGKVYAGDGAVGSSGLTFELDKDTGVYRIGANTLGIATNGAERLRVDTTGVSLDAGVTYLNRIGDQVGTWLWDWDGKQTIESTLTGTGGYAIATVPAAYTTFSTGATSGGTSGGRQTLLDGAVNGVGKLRLLKIIVDHGEIDANTNSSMYVTDESATGSPSNTARHIGIREAGAVVNFSTGDNTTEQTTDITAFVAANTTTFYDITYDGTTARCYVGGTLRATHATNVPATANAQPIFRAYITNTAAANKHLYVTKLHAVFSI